MNKEKIIKAGKIAKEVREWIKPKIKKGIPLIEIAELIENKIAELGGKPAFPTNLSINEIAAHYTPSYDDKTIAHGLLKVDFGVHIEGWISDQAFSIDLENSKENKDLIKASEKALEKAIQTINKNVKTSEIGKAIQNEIKSNNFQPIINLSGHEIEQNDLHAGLTIPNYDNKSYETITPGLYAIEPFATLGFSSGKIQDGNPSEIYQLQDSKNVRSPLSREILEYIAEEYYTLPFCSRWLVKKFGTKALLALKQLEQNGNLHQYSQLIESSKSKVSQSEHTVFIDEKGDKIVTTL
jgi:methionyl aminopeptidase